MFQCTSDKYGELMKKNHETYGNEETVRKISQNNTISTNDPIPLNTITTEAKFEQNNCI